MSEPVLPLSWQRTSYARHNHEDGEWYATLYDSEGNCLLHHLHPHFAEFIVRACNSHDETAAALEAVEWYEIEVGVEPDFPSYLMVCPLCRGEKPKHKDNCQLAAALANAKEGL